jgi:transposase
MASAYSQDLRDRVIDAVVRGEMSRRAAAARFGVSESSAIKWVQRFERSGSRAASKMGGYLRARLEPHREFLEALRAEKSDITLKALCDRLLAERGVRADTAMMSRFFRRIGVTLKKRRSSRAGSCGHKAPSQALAKPSEARRSFATGVHRRDLDQDQHDPALRLGAART